MAKTIAIGIQDFKNIIEEDCFYIDKTDFIREWWDSKDAVTLITRPRRFGKTLNMSMLDYFFSNEHKEDAHLFEGLSIWQDEKYRNLQGEYPVIFLSFADIKAKNYDLARKAMCENLAKQYDRYCFLKDGNILTDREKRLYDHVGSDMDDADAATILRNLSEYLYRFYRKKVIILLDEYDTPMQEAYANGYWEELVAFTRSLFNTTFKANPYLERAIMTGITRVSRESMFSDLNNLKVVTTTSLEYATAFGFTESEVFDAIDQCGLDQKDKVKLWYDGFIFGNVKDIYNPWSILNYLDTGIVTTYWANTSENSLAGKLVREGNPSIKVYFEQLLCGQVIESPIDEQIVYNRLDGNVPAILSLLVASGYLKVVSFETYGDIPEGEEPKYRLALTNLEVRTMFGRMVHDWFSQADGAYNEFIKALLLGDRKAMNTYMNRVALSTFSYFDTGNRPSGSEPERFYHGFVLGLLVDLKDQYMVYSNQESGFGRYDIMLEPRDMHKNDAIIIEFKVHDPEDEADLKATVEAALHQIEDKQYAVALREKGIAEERIRKYGFAFEGKRVLIG